MENEKPIIIELYELWNMIKKRFAIVAPQPKSFTLRKEVVPVLSMDGHKLFKLDLTTDDNVAPGAYDSIFLTPPDGYYYIIRNIYFHAPNPVGSSAGSHGLYVYDVYSYNMAVTNTFGSDARIRQFQFSGNVEIPGNSQQQFDLITGALVSPGNDPLDFRYCNNTNAMQDGTRRLVLYVEQVKEEVGV